MPATPAPLPQTAFKFVGPAQGPMLNIMGTRNEEKLTGADTAGRLSLFETTAGPGDGIPLHVHTREDELFYVLEGEVAFTANGKQAVGGPGTCLYLPMHLPHSWAVQGDAPARVLIMTLPGTFNTFFAELACPPGQMRPMPEVVAICARHGITFVQDGAA